jgi:hypothetical protein
MMNSTIHDGPATRKELAILGVIDLLQENRYGMTSIEVLDARVGQAFGRSALRGALAFLARADLIKVSYAAALDHGRRRKMFSLTARSQRAIEANEGK